MAHSRSMKVKEVKCEGLQTTVVQRAAESSFKSVLFAIIFPLPLVSRSARNIAFAPLGS